MQLTDVEGKAFWPVYDQYQRDLEAINQRIAELIDHYAGDYRNNTMSDEKALKLINETVAIEKAEAQAEGILCSQVEQSVAGEEGGSVHPD